MDLTMHPQIDLAIMNRIRTVDISLGVVHASLRPYVGSSILIGEGWRVARQVVTVSDHAGDHRSRT